MYQSSMLRVSYEQNITSEQLINSIDAVEYLKCIWDLELINMQEQVYILYLNNDNRVIGWRCLNTGCSTETLINTRLAVSIGLCTLAEKVIIAHNHPTGNLNPSLADIRATERLAAAFGLVDMALLDHIIITSSGYYSLKDNGLMAAA